MPRRRRAIMTMVIGLGLALAASLVAHAAGPKAQVLWSKTRNFQIPVTVPPENLKLVRELILWVSDDAGDSWKKTSRTTPDSPRFPFRASKDGEFWFAVQTMDTKGELYPNGDTRPEPSLKVMVDSTPPTIMLKALARRGSIARVQWEVQDDHLLLNTLTLEYQEDGAREWRVVPLGQGEIAYIGAKSWDVRTADPGHARMTIRDQAGNTRSVETPLPDGLAENPGPLLADSRPSAPAITPIASGRTTPPSADFGETDPFADFDAKPQPPSRGSARPKPPEDSFDPPAMGPAPENDRDFETSPSMPVEARPAASAPSAGPTLLVPSPRFALKYQVEDAGPDGPAHVVLWVTRDMGRTWSRLPEDPDRVSPYNVDLGGEGIIGLWLEVMSASGLGDLPPRPNDRPHQWVEVDSVAPVVTLARPRVGSGPNAGKVILEWQASDPHLVPNSVKLSYREDREDAPWVLILDRQDTRGKYVWVAPSNVPTKFHLKAEAVDTLGNIGWSDTVDTGPVILDRARPKGKILGLDQANGINRQ